MSDTPVSIANIPHTNTNFVSMPGIGIDYWIEEHTHRLKDSLLVLDARLYSGDESSRLISNIEQWLGTQQAQKPCVVALVRLDRAEFPLSRQFFSGLRGALERSAVPVQLVTFTNKELLSEFSDELAQNLSLIAHVEYLKPLRFDALQRFEACTKTQYNLCGGHVHLIRSLHGKHATDLTGRICEELLQYLTPVEQKVLLRIIADESLPEDKSVARLEKLGFVTKRAGETKVFCEIFEQYLRQRTSKTTHLPYLESKLFETLLLNKGAVVAKDNIVEAVWGQENVGEVSDWALNALVYRLRKSEYFIQSGHEISSRKKLGYQLD